MTGRSDTAPLLQASAMLALAAEAAIGRLVLAFQEAGVDVLLLKGVSLERWLYDLDEPRVAGDVDLLVAPGRLGDAERLLRGLGYVNRYDGASPSWAEEHADVWVRERQFPVDLHRHLWGFAAPPEAVWQALWDARDHMRVGAVECAILGEPARALSLAIHAAHHDGVGRPVEDLRRAIDRLDMAAWRAACRLADRLDARVGLAAGLGVIDGGLPIRDALGLAAAQPEDIHVVPRSWSIPATGEGFLRVRQAEGTQDKARLLWRELFPSRQFMQTRSRQQRLASRGTRGLAAAYGVRAIQLVVAAPRGLQAARRMRDL